MHVPWLTLPNKSPYRINKILLKSPCSATPWRSHLIWCSHLFHHLTQAPRPSRKSLAFSCCCARSCRLASTVFLGESGNSVLSKRLRIARASNHWPNHWAFVPKMTICVVELYNYIFWCQFVKFARLEIFKNKRSKPAGKCLHLSKWYLILKKWNQFKQKKMGPWFNMV